jgi:hypothetical protein
MTLTLRKSASLLGASALGVSMMTGAAWAATSAASARLSSGGDHSDRVSYPRPPEP